MKTKQLLLLILISYLTACSSSVNTDLSTLHTNDSINALSTDIDQDEDFERRHTEKLNLLKYAVKRRTNSYYFKVSPMKEKLRGYTYELVASVLSGPNPDAVFKIHDKHTDTSYLFSENQITTINGVQENKKEFRLTAENISSDELHLYHINLNGQIIVENSIISTFNLSLPSMNYIIDGKSYLANEPMTIEEMTIHEHEYGSGLSGTIEIKLKNAGKHVNVYRKVSGTKKFIGNYQVEKNRINVDSNDVRRKDYANFTCKLIIENENNTVVSDPFVLQIQPNKYEKQKAIYVTHSYERPLADTYVTGIKVIHNWENLSELRDFNREWGGIYAATTVGTEKGPGGYMGPQVAYSQNKDQVIFSIWDSKKEKSYAIPVNDTTVDGICERNCQDGRCGGQNNGTKCKLKYPMDENIDYEFELRMVSKNVHIVGPAIETQGTQSYTGNVWQATVKNPESNTTSIIGKMLFSNKSKGIKKANFFREHLKIMPCNGFYVKAKRRLEITESKKSNSVVSAKAIVTGKAKKYTCNSYRITADENQNVFIETGGNIEPNFHRNDKPILF